ncbi:MAG: beta-Ala-His dipeptidase [Spirochaetales bacterium]|nr:beta-Ala-His dipeptidase [Spirochaetales bacterium]
MNFPAMEPEQVWKYFRDISALPRCSGHEEKIRQYIINLSAGHGLEYRQDRAGNLVVRKAASAGKSGARAVILQAHLDMVCVKDANSGHNFSTDPLDLYLDGDWLRARGTSLGADNGIGVAMILAVLSSESVVHGPLTALFTVEEETGLIGAGALENGLASGDCLINLDTEEEGELYIGCAGGKVIEARRELIFVDCPAGYSGISLEVSGLHGGHSGIEIGKGYANAVLCAMEIVSLLSVEYHFALSDIRSPGKHNAIPVYCSVKGVVPKEYQNKAIKAAEALARKICSDYRDIDAMMKITADSSNVPDRIVEAVLSKQIIQALAALPHGVIEMRRDVEGLVNTSANLAIVEPDGKELRVVCSQRSFVEHARDFAAVRMMHILGLAGFSTECTVSYPPWTPQTDSVLLDLCSRIWEKQSGNKALVKAVHAGLECGILTERLGKMEMISLGPDMKEVHTVNERLSVPSVGRVWRFVLEILAELAEWK